VEQQTLEAEAEEHRQEVDLLQVQELQEEQVALE
tara:strand:- start:21 stop:122 length:102 start_codon:yes stop_codon:yes gene_type:complete